MKCPNKAVNFILAACAIFIFAGCAKEPQVIVKTQYKDVLIPAPCIKKMPDKPKYDYEDIQTARDLMEYYKLCEELLKGCANERD